MADKSNSLERVIDRLEESRLSYCVIGGVAVNAYADPVVTQDLDIVLATAELGRAREPLKEFRIEEFEHSVKVYDPGSKLQVQIQKDAELGQLLERAERREVLDLMLPVASPEDLVRLKVAAALEPTRRASKRQQDLADISRLVEAFPELRAGLPDEITRRLVE